MDIVEILKALGDGTRLRILHLLYKETLCVCHLEAVLNLSQPNASRHLIKLKYAKLITSEKQAQWVYYSVDKTSLERYPFVRELIVKELEQRSYYQEDLARLHKYREQGDFCETRANMKGQIKLLRL